MKYAEYLCQLCNKELSKKDEFCPDCGPKGKKIYVAR
jgi:rRNA maturation endonuclease Nob1